MKSIKIAAAALGAICVLSLAGCNSAKNSGTGTTANNTTQANLTTTAALTSVNNGAVAS
jgi:hypothetical protein